MTRQERQGKTWMARRSKNWTPDQDMLLARWWSEDPKKAVKLTGKTWDDCFGRWERNKEGDVLLNFRKCHEPGCDRWTTDYRCTECQQKWKARHEVCGSCVDDGWV